MANKNTTSFARGARVFLGLVAAGFVAACSVPPADHVPGTPFDPYEADNRNVHAFNKSLDKALIRPAGKGYSAVLPDDIEDTVGQFAFNLSLPSQMVNNVLQGNLRGAGNDTMRFVVNSTLGFGGLFDVASDFGMVEATDTDFGETLHVWGADEGAYIELPLLGPSTERDAVGKVVDMFTNPLSYVLPDPEKYYGTGAAVAARLGDRGRYAETLDSILYDSADSYAQARLIYLQNRRFELGSGGGDDYLDPYSDPYLDPYEDPYAQ